MRRFSQSKGFKLVEIMVSLFIFATCLLTMLGIFPTSMQALNQSKYLFLAQQVARQEMELLKNTQWKSLENFSTSVQQNPDKYYKKISIVYWINGRKSVITFETQPMVTVYKKDKKGIPRIVNARVLVKYQYGSIIDNSANGYYKSVDLETLVASPYY